MKPAKLSAAKTLELMRIAVYSADDTITAGEALSFIGSLFSEDPNKRFERGMLPTLLNMVSAPRPKRRRSNRTA